MNTCNLSSTNRPIWISLKHTNTNRNYHQHFCSKKNKNQKPIHTIILALHLSLWYWVAWTQQVTKTYAQKSSTVSNLEMRRRLACHVLLLSFLKNQRAHLGKTKTNKRLTTEYDHILSTFVRLVVKKNLQTFTTSHILYNSKIHLRRLTLLEYNSLTVFSIFATVIHKVEWYMNVISCIDLYFYKKRQTWINAYLFCSGCLMYVSGFTTFWTAVSHFSVSPFAGTEFDT